MNIFKICFLFKIEHDFHYFEVKCMIEFHIWKGCKKIGLISMTNFSRGCGGPLIIIFICLNTSVPLSSDSFV